MNQHQDGFNLYKNIQMGMALVMLLTASQLTQASPSGVSGKISEEILNAEGSINIIDDGRGGGGGGTRPGPSPRPPGGPGGGYSPGRPGVNPDFP
ncbi:MAG TPA: hypothetical protein PLU50_05590, partial [Pseudobdellovibrionaceae bacterium]|nr:hypothetical protein [Pseudobdellovibrionaceae bacterium]